MRKAGLVWCLLAILAALGAPQLAAAQDRTAKGKRVAMFMGPTQDKYLGALSKGFETAATAMGMSVTVFSSPFDPALQGQQIDDAIAQKFDLFVVQTISQKAIVPPLTRAKAAGIPVFLVVVPLEASTANDALYASYIGYDDAKLGQLAASSLAEALKSAGRTQARIAVIAGSMAEGKAVIRERAFREEMTRHPGLQVVVTEDVKWNPVQAERSTGQLLARFAGQGGLDGLYGMNDSLANGAIQAAEAAGVKIGPDKGGLIVVGGNCQAPGIKNIQSGKMAATVFVLPIEEGRRAAETAKTYFEGGKVERRVFLPTEPVTRANLGTTAQACSY
ncbi:sugar ABC transporter substrate-binding protein [Rhodoplanes sp. TEM]|uniref:Sugar ABC transporter substrate-binding protein n=1 Tax=Rhodoplanes tepidamans TaxID=200616 RepID=A0ABT5J8G3_RHOTP|nr:MULTISPECIES: sugar ABC transporter substrate-binding protein [Rhodoplanes]MDC7785942.1 sugar ABC transporter substrate-binding protein [Rhodoplanes tepidamans]MDC7986246.1 sugar ABC transporter substrate-binding protein [Rhodoplanes sp. TEM]MDQ0355439.1 ABC-type sugar transport system substrate-binding protein [Rhodoplanes tepidamans]